MIFAREVSDHLTSLVKKIDAATSSNSKCRMGSFVVFLNDEEGYVKKLKDLATKESLKKTVLTLSGWRLARSPSKDRAQRPAREAARAGRARVKRDAVRRRLGSKAKPEDQAEAKAEG